MRGVREMSTGAFVQEIARVLILVELLSLKVRKVEKVIMKYMRRVRSVREGENCKIKTIQPR